MRVARGALAGLCQGVSGRQGIIGNGSVGAPGSILGASPQEERAGIGRIGTDRLVERRERPGGVPGQKLRSAQLGVCGAQIDGRAKPLAKGIEVAFARASQACTDAL